MKKIEIYDTLLRDGAQAEDISFTLEDKLLITEKLSELGIHFIEGGWPGSNPKDEDYFKKVKKLKLGSSHVVAFGATRHPKKKASEDPQLGALIAAETPVVTIFGKSWCLHVQEALRISNEENRALIHDSVSHLKRHVSQVFYDAEHFFDGYKSDPEYALATIRAAHEAGADRIVLCDTNGGSLPNEIGKILDEVMGQMTAQFGIHCHNDSGVAVANSLVALQKGVVQVQGTMNGYGERCGNANLTTLMANIKLKLGMDCISDTQLTRLREVSRFVDERVNRFHLTHAPYVGDSAFAPKGGVHVSAIRKNPQTYEHISPEKVGNRQRVLVSELSGQGNILYKAEEFGLKIDDKDPAVKEIVRRLKELESMGFEYEGAEASFEILMKKALKRYKSHFRLISFNVSDEVLPDGQSRSEATLKIEVNGEIEHTVSGGDGPVHALDRALRKALERFYPPLKEVRLLDYKVRVLPSHPGTAATVRVMIESADDHDHWGTVGVSENIIQASWQALVDSMDYKLMKTVKK